MSVLQIVQKNNLQQYFEHWQDFHQDVQAMHDQEQAMVQLVTQSADFAERFHQHNTLNQRISLMRSVYARVPRTNKEFIRAYLWPELYELDWEYDFESEESFHALLIQFLESTMKVLQSEEVDEFTFEYLKPYKESYDQLKRLQTKKNDYFTWIYQSFSLTGTCNDMERVQMISVEAAAYRIIQLKMSYERRMDRCRKHQGFYNQLLHQLSKHERRLLEAELSGSGIQDEAVRRNLSLKVRAIYELMIEMQDSSSKDYENTAIV